MFTVYKHTNILNGKCYIGCTHKSVEERSGKNGILYSRHPRFSIAIKEFGWENFSHSVLGTYETSEDAYNAEKHFISLYRSTLPEYGYNSTSGGGSYSEETSQRLSEANRKRIKSRDSVMKSALKHIGLKHSDETKRKMSESQRKIAAMGGFDKRTESIRKNLGKRVVVCKENDEPISFICIADAARALGVDSSCVSRACKYGNTVKKKYKCYYKQCID